MWLRVELKSMALESRGSMKGPDGRKSAFQEVFSVELVCCQFAFRFLLSLVPHVAALPVLRINNVLYISNQLTSLL
jgi:hypothetical protein